MAKICLKCEREFGNSSVKCPICKCELVIKEDTQALKANQKKPVHSYQQRSTQPKQMQSYSEQTASQKRTQQLQNTPSQKNQKLQPQNNTEKKSGEKGKQAKSTGVIVSLSILSIILWISVKSGTRNNDITKMNSSEMTSGQLDTDTGEDVDQETLLYTAIEEVVGSDRLIQFVYNPYMNTTRIVFKGADSLTPNMIVSGAYLDIKDILKAIQPLIDTDVYIFVKYPLVDAYGNSEDHKVIQADFSLDTIKKINFDKFLSDNIPVVADSWWNHRVFEIVN